LGPILKKKVRANILDSAKFGRETSRSPKKGRGTSKKDGGGARDRGEVEGTGQKRMNQEGARKTKNI